MKTKIKNFKIKNQKSFISIKSTNSIQELKKIFTSLDTLIWFTSKNNADFKSKTISYFVNSLELNNITDYVRKHEPLASVLLSNIIEIYEIFEEEIFFLIKINLY